MHIDSEKSILSQTGGMVEIKGGLAIFNIVGHTSVPSLIKFLNYGGCVRVQVYCDLR